MNKKLLVAIWIVVIASFLFLNHFTLSSNPLNLSKSAPFYVSSGFTWKTISCQLHEGLCKDVNSSLN